jgi:hypothetical protein
MRSVKQDQPELFKPIQSLQENTSNLVTYKKCGELGVTLVMLEPVLRQILTKNHNGTIRREDITDFEVELNEKLEHAQYSDYDIEIDQFKPLALYGKNKQWLGVQLNREDYRLVGDRAVVEHYIRDNYDRPNGEGVSKRFLSKNLQRMLPHITIGEVDYSQIPDEELGSFVDNPSQYLIERAYERMECNRQEYGTSLEVTPIVFPEQASLNGLRVFCQRRD